MDVRGIWITTHSVYKKNHLFFKSWRWRNIKIQPAFELQVAILAIKQTALDFVFVEDEFLATVDPDFRIQSFGLKTPWVFMLSSKINSVYEHSHGADYYKSFSRPFLQTDFDNLLLQIAAYKEGCEMRKHKAAKKTFLIPPGHGNSIIPVIKVYELCVIRKNMSETHIQFDNGVTYSYRTSFETFLSLTRSYSNIFEVTPGLLINLDKLEKIVHDSKHDEFICSLVTERQIELSKSQRNRLIAHIQYYS